MRLREVVECSLQTASTRSRKKKTASLARCLGQLGRDERTIGVSFLSGEMRQGRIGLGYATVTNVRPPPAAESSLTLADVDACLTQIKDTSGKGSVKAKERLLGQLLERATEEEQTFLRRLLFGELRQGANAGILAEAIAEAAEVPSRAVRRAAMLAGDLGAIAEAAFDEGEAGLSRFDVELFRPLQPMLAQTCDTASEALVQLGASDTGGSVLDYKLDGARIQV
ncbi:MAG: ATP-dependent DNA ligase, partial [Polyangiaceae bacterium]